MAELAGALALVAGLLGWGWFRERRGWKRLTDLVEGIPAHRPTPLLYAGPRAPGDLVKAVNRLVGEYHDHLVEASTLERARREFLSGVSHDLRTPLTSLIGYLRALADEADETGSINREYLGILMAKSTLLKERMEKLFDLARLESGEWVLEPQTIDAAELVRQALIEFRPQWEPLETTWDLPEGPLLVTFDRLALVRVIQNLVQNALTHGREGSWLGVSLQATAKGGVLTVEDQGPGIAADLRRHLFERRRPGVHRGGLGLAIAAELVRRQGATLECIARPRGTAFVLTLASPE